MLLVLVVIGWYIGCGMIYVSQKKFAFAVIKWVILVGCVLVPAVCGRYQRRNVAVQFRNGKQSVQDVIRMLMTVVTILLLYRIMIKWVDYLRFLW